MLDIESNLRILLPPGSEAVVELVKPYDAPDRPLLAAFCRFNLEKSSDEGSDREAQEIISTTRKQLEKALPLHMVPKAFVTLKKMPMNSSNKTDRKSLRENAGKLGYKQLISSSLRAAAANNGHRAPPKNDTEQILAELWAVILRQDVDSVDRRDHFLALGGDSLTAIRLVSAARLKGLELTTQSILMFPILQDMAELASSSKVNLAVDAVASNGIDHTSSPSDDLITMRATDFQEWAVSVGALNGGWIDHLAYDISGRLDVERLEKSCKELVDAHPILRAVFRLTNNTVYMDVPAQSNPRLDVHEVTIDDLENRTKQIYSTDRISPLGSPIVRFYLIKASPIRNRLIIRISHAQYDAFCAETIGRHLRLLYFGQQLPPTLPFHKYARKIQDEQIVQRSKVYWRKYLKDSEIPKLVERSRPGPPFDNTLDGELTRSVTEPNLRRHGINTVVVAKAAWALTVSALCQSFDIVFGDFISGRQVDIPNIDTVIGPCVNFTPVRVRLSPTMTNLELMKQIQGDLISAIPHESLGFKQIIQECTNWGRTERFSSIINFVNIETASSTTEIWTNGDDKDTLQVDTMYEEQQHDKTDLWLLCLPGHLASKQDAAANGTEKMLELHLRYSKRVFKASIIEQILASYCQTLNLLATAPDNSIYIPWIPEEQRTSAGST